MVTRACRVVVGRGTRSSSSIEVLFAFFGVLPSPHYSLALSVASSALPGFPLSFFVSVFPLSCRWLVWYRIY